LVAVAAEAEQILERGIATHDIRHACALARGYLELARSYGEQVSVEDVERVLDRLRSAVEAALLSPREEHGPDWFEQNLGCGH
jgi:hypothetical protein